MGATTFSTTTLSKMSSSITTFSIKKLNTTTQRIIKPRNPYNWERISTLDLFVLTSSNKLLFTLKLSISFRN
jgi:hypothetical protein